MNATVTTPPIGRRATRKQDRHQAIIEAARQSFFEDGYAATSMSGLLTTLGGSKATLWSYFRSKEELFSAVIEDAIAAFRGELDGAWLEGANLEDTLVAFSRGFMRKLSHPEGVSICRLIVAESGRFPELGQIFYERASKSVEQKLAAYFQKQIDDGLLIDGGAEKMAQFLVGLCGRRQSMNLWGIDSPDGEQLDEDAERFAEYFLKLFGNTPK